jgi:hypothetical protein
VAQELRPGSGRGQIRFDAVPMEDLPDRGRGDLDPEDGQFTVDAR